MTVNTYLRFLRIILILSQIGPTFWIRLSILLCCVSILVWSKQLSITGLFKASFITLIFYALFSAVLSQESISDYVDYDTFRYLPYYLFTSFSYLLLCLTPFLIWLVYKKNIWLGTLRFLLFYLFFASTLCIIFWYRRLLSILVYHYDRYTWAYLDDPESLIGSLLILFFMNILFYWLYQRFLIKPKS